MADNRPFQLHLSLAKKLHLLDLDLCAVLMENNAFYPWIFLVPRLDGIREMTDLSMDERIQLMREMDLCERSMKTLFNPDQLNVAAIGNRTPQLHVHIICRRRSDPDWPGTVWDGSRTAYGEEEFERTAEEIRRQISADWQKLGGLSANRGD